MSKPGQTGPGRQVTFEIEIDEEGNAILRLPHGKGQQRNAASVADLTQGIADALGETIERHVGDHTHHANGTVTYHNRNQQTT
jgi:hypothetical protein